MPKEFAQLFKELLEHGSSSIELGFWQELIPKLSKEEQDKLKENFETQLKLLKEKAKLKAEGK